MPNKKAISKNTNKNCYIELCRFIACYIIFSFHSGGVFHNGWIMVEFFFLLTGYFSMKHINNHPNDCLNISFPIKYTFKKLIKIFPYSTIGFISHFLTTILVYKLSIRSILRLFMYLPGNIFLLPTTGVLPVNAYISDNLTTDYLIATELWYICTIAVSMPIMILLITKLDKKIGHWCITYLPLLIYGYIIFNDGTIQGWHWQHNTYLYLNLRALAGLLLGCCIFYIVKKICNYNFTILGKAVLTIVEVLCFTSVCFVSCKQSIFCDIDEIILLVIALSLTLSGKTFTAKLNNSLFLLLGKLSLPIYCIHIPIMNLANYLHIYTNGSFQHILLFIFITIVALILTYIIDLLSICFRKLAIFIRKSLICN